MKKIFYIIIPLLIIATVFLATTAYLRSVRDNNTDKAFAEENTVYGTREPTIMGTSKPELSNDTTSSGTTDGKEPEDSLIVNVTGDILLGRGVEKALKKESRSFDYVFEKVADDLKKADVIFGNLEEPITDREHSLTGIGDGGKWVLRSRTQAFEAIKMAGFNMLSLANNHILDYYTEGLNDTFDILKKNDIAFTGAGNSLDEARSGAIIERKGMKIGLLAYTDMAEITYKGNPPLKFLAGIDKPGVAPRKLEMIKEDILRLRPQVDLLIVSLHWGIEDSFDVQDSQKEFAHTLIDSGADIIAGHHPHQFQGIEIYKGKPIFYSLGNFMFDQNDPENQESFYLNLKYSGTTLEEMNAYPVRTIDKSQVVPQSGEGAVALLNRELELCRSLETDCEISGDAIEFNLE